MVGCAAVGVAVIATAGAAAPAAAAGAMSGIGIGGTASTLTGAVAGGAVAGSAAGSSAVFGGAAVAGGTATAGATIAGGAAGATTGSLFGGGMFGVLSGPVGWAVLGAEQKDESLSYDCWNAVVRDRSLEPSHGRLLRDVAASPTIKEVTVVSENDSKVRHIFFLNVWNERFCVDFGYLPSGELAAHAVRM